LCDYLKNIVFFLVILAKIRTLLRFCAVILVFFIKPSGRDHITVNRPLFWLRVVFL